MIVALPTVYTPDPAAIMALVEGGYITRRQHPSADLWILNYAPRAQFERAWNEHTLACRGLIVDGNWQVVARPFPKFFNLEEHQGPLPAEAFDVYDKVDGSLGILYQAPDGWALATRGSFSSEQAIAGTAILRRKYGHLFHLFDPSETLLFEIVYPANRIVVDYGDREDVILLAVTLTATGHEFDLDSYKHQGFTVVECFGFGTDAAALRAQPGEANREGYVLRFQSGLRVKVKFEEYVRLHRLLTGLSTARIWDCLRNGQDVTDLVAGGTAEAIAWAQAETDKLLSGYQAIENECRAGFVDHGDRKANAAAYKQHAYPHVLFKMLDQKPYDEAIWKMLKPERSVPFARDIDG